MTSGLGLEFASHSAQRPRLCPSTTYGRCGGLGRSSGSRDEFEVSLGPYEALPQQTIMEPTLSQLELRFGKPRAFHTRPKKTWLVWFSAQPVEGQSYAEVLRTFFSTCTFISKCRHALPSASPCPWSLLSFSPVCFPRPFSKNMSGLLVFSTVSSKRLLD